MYNLEQRAKTMALQSFDYLKLIVARFQARNHSPEAQSQPLTFKLRVSQQKRRLEIEQGMGQPQIFGDTPHSSSHPVC